MTTPKPDQQSVTPPDAPPQSLAAQPVPPTAHPSRAPIIALTVLAAVFALVTGIFTALCTGARTDRDHTAAARADKERALADVTAQQGLADRTLRGNRSRESTLTAEHDLLTQCVDAAKGYFDLPPERSPESTRLFRIMYEVCPQV